MELHRVQFVLKNLYDEQEGKLSLILRSEIELAGLAARKKEQLS